MQDSTPARAPVPASAPVAAPAAPATAAAPASVPLLSRFHGLRRVADKVGRKLGKLVGRPDNAPWVMRPGRGTGERRYVDFLFALDYMSPNEQLPQLFREAMNPYGLSVLLVNNRNLDAVQRDLKSGWLRPVVFLDLCSATDGRYWELLKTAAAAGIHTVADPATQPTWTIKASSHPRLAGAGLPVPATVVLGKADPDRELTAEERRALGERVVVKPSFGVAGRGTVVGVPATGPAIAQARDFNRDDDWLVQRMVSWVRLDEPNSEGTPRHGYLRAYNVLGHRTLLWWYKEGDFEGYDVLTWADARRHDLLPAVELIDRLADLSGMEFFSSEIAITAPAPGDPALAGAAGTGRERFVFIDYLNDQCDMDPAPGPHKRSVPAEWVRWVCGRFAEYVYRRKHGLAPDGHRGLFLPPGPPVPALAPVAAPAAPRELRLAESRCA